MRAGVEVAGHFGLAVQDYTALDRAESPLSRHGGAADFESRHRRRRAAPTQTTRWMQSRRAALRWKTRRGTWSATCRSGSRRWCCTLASGRFSTASLPASHRTEPLPAPLDPHVEGHGGARRERPRCGRPRANQADRHQPGAGLYRFRGGLGSIDIERVPRSGFSDLG